MALFGKKTSDGGATPKAPQSQDNTAGAKAGGLSFGRKKKDATPVPDAASVQASGANDPGGIEDFSDFSDAALGTAPAAATNGKGRAAKADKSARKPARPRIVNGTAVGLNIGNDSIKVVELQAKGGDIAVTAMGMVHTPPESISNGVVMSVGTLQTALRDLFKQAGIKSKRVTISVAGTGALVVRVIEVPRMSDKELDDNMRVDADRYIPFPPSEVIMDYKALRELPSDPDSPNMDVLLAAAQREIIDLHIKVLEEAKFEARAIEVEPLAVSRALTQTVTKQAQALHTQSLHNGHSNGHAGSDEVDYSRVSAIINIGAAGTEISVLRGDVLVFTRTIPNGGNALTQAIVDYLGLPWHDAERVKREWGDALPPHIADGTRQSTLGGATDDWSEFGGFDDASLTTPASGFAQDDVSTILDDSPQSATSQSTGQEPREQHGQKEDDPADKPAPAFDFSGFKFSDEDEPAAPAPQAQPATPAAPSANDTEPAASAFSFGNEPAAAAESGAATTGAAPADAFDLSSFNFGLENDEAATPATSEPATDASRTPFDLAAPGASAAEETPVPAAIPVSGLDATDAEAPPSAWNLEDLGVPDAASSPAVSTNAAAGDVPAFDLPNFDDTTGSAAATPGATGDFDLDTFFNTPESGTAPANEMEPGLGFGTAAAAVAGAGGAAGFDAVSFGSDFGDDFTNFGAGLSNDVSTGIDAETVYSILHPLLEELASEIRRSLEYHASRYPDAVVQNITLVGGGAQFKNIDAFLTQSLGIPTAVGKPLARLSVRAPQLPQGYADANEPLFAVALGLALRDLVA
ncbi:MAG: type pilus assembly protein PilM [Abditibacteriota bacterium]|nr:type pilus assembly protein PilM [Abditibacteriota bacterium]